MRLTLRVTFAALAVAVLGVTTPVAHAQTTTTQPPLEDVTLRGRVLRADGSPLANTPVRVDAVNDSGFAILGFFFTLGFSTITCFTGPAETCPVPNSKRFSSATDAAGNYSFTFHNAHRRGIQTDTDYVFSVGVPSQAGGGTFVVASYELELLDAVHNAPDLTIWDPKVTLNPAEREYRAEYDRRPSSKNGLEVLIDGKSPLGAGASDDGRIDARGVEDTTFSVVPHASKDVTAAGTIYHQRFTAAPVTRKGDLVPLSRNAPCTATRADGTEAHCGYTDGDLITPGVVDPSPCGEFIPQTGCQSPVKSVTVDLGAAKEVGDVRDRCSCTLEASTDAQRWFNLPTSGRFSGEQMRYVRLSGESLASIPEISVWPPWPDAGEGIHLLPGVPRLGSGAGDGGDKPWGLAAIAVVALGVALRTLDRRRRGDDGVAEVSRAL